jgi:PPOX class probable FMN-dependent enzyme
MDNRFDEVIATSSRLRELTGRPSERAKRKVINHIDEICRRFIAACPFVLVASRGADGRLDISPKGDPCGFVAILDEKTLAIPDRPGNNRHDTFENLLAHEEIGLLFLIPSNGDTLRVSGTGRIVRDSALQARLAVGDKQPNLALVVTVEEAFMHCQKSLVRSRLWDPEGWPDCSAVPTLAEAIIAQAKPAETAAEINAIVAKSDAHLY